MSMHIATMPIRSAIAWASLILACLLGGAAAAATAAPSERDDGVLILGGAGRTGSAVARQLVARGEKVTVLVRPTTDRSRLAGLPVKYVVGDATDPAAARAAFEGKRYGVVVETVQFSQHVEPAWTTVYEHFMPWAKRTGVAQWIMFGGGCTDWAQKDCPLSPPLYKAWRDVERAEHILRDSGVPYTVIRVSSLAPTDPGHPQAFWATGKAYLSTDLRRFGGVMRADLAGLVVGCVRAERCLNHIFVADDPTLKPQIEHFICKRSYETDKLYADPRCGDVPKFTDAHPVEPKH